MFTIKITTRKVFMAPLCILIAIAGGAYMLVSGYIYDNRGATKGVTDSICEVPCIEDELKELNAKGMIQYAYIVGHRTTRYVFTGKISEKEFLDYFSEGKGWSLQQVTADMIKSHQEHCNRLKISVSEFPIGKLDDDYVYKIIKAESEDGFWAICKSVFHKEDESFIVIVNRRRLKEDSGFL